VVKVYAADLHGWSLQAAAGRKEHRCRSWPLLHGLQCTGGASRQTSACSCQLLAHRLSGPTKQTREHAWVPNDSVVSCASGILGKLWNGRWQAWDEKELLE
jgi:hypothetical protein